ncbi:hypothetical protein [Rubrivivax sp. A210]|uniref:hypothetical protein n=1 Tax=Rubrivivax sp. A210 TaxID=2772301 RepID=UPI001917A513|nr:hypothetical protein [Rubrivivax sp. A210]
MQRRRYPPRFNPARWMAGGLALAMAGLAMWWAPPAPPAAAALAPPAPADNGPWLSPALGTASAELTTPAGAAPLPVVQPAPGLPAAPVLPGHALPTLDAAERAALREAMSPAVPMDGASRREFEALLFHDGLLRLQALREAGDLGAEHGALVQELRAALPAREAAADLAPPLLQQARRALDLPAAGPRR